mmetsp:Transcript_66384/g.175775  ORF Transcript_66384/g.175775 Transcript_66384/m.175775 type:complete len:330 (+) Transcript_66384:105-1094(+)
MISNVTVSILASKILESTTTLQQQNAKEKEEAWKDDEVEDAHNNFIVRVKLENQGRARQKTEGARHLDAVERVCQFQILLHVDDLYETLDRRNQKDVSNEQHGVPGLEGRHIFGRSSQHRGDEDDKEVHIDTERHDEQDTNQLLQNPELGLEGPQLSLQLVKEWFEPFGKTGPYSLQHLLTSWIDGPKGDESAIGRCLQVHVEARGQPSTARRNRTVRTLTKSCQTLPTSGRVAELLLETHQQRLCCLQLGAVAAAKSRLPTRGGIKEHRDELLCVILAKWLSFQVIPHDGLNQGAHILGHWRKKTVLKRVQHGYDKVLHILQGAKVKL